MLSLIRAIVKLVHGDMQFPGGTQLMFVGECPGGWTQVDAVGPFILAEKDY